MWLHFRDGLYCIGGLVFLALNGVNAFAEDLCKPIDYLGFKSYVEAENPLEIIFFGSWCPDCKSSLKRASGRSLLVATFDSKQAAEEALVYLKKTDIKCFFDEGAVAKKLQINELPFSLSGPYKLPK